MSDTQQGPGWWQASDGKWYAPQPQAPTPPAAHQPQPAPQVIYQQVPKKGHGCLYAILGAAAVLVVIIVIVVVAASSSSKSTVTNNLANNLGGANLGGAAPTARYSLGQTAKTGGFNITAYAVKDPQAPGNSFSTPAAGSHFVSVDVQVTNPSPNQQAFSSLISFHLLDSLNHQFDESLAGAGITPGAPDGQISGGQSIRGFVVFEIPDGTTGLKFRAQGNLTAAGAVWTLS